MSKEIKIEKLTADHFYKWLEMNVPEDSARGISNFLMLALGSSISTSNLSDEDDDSAAADEGKDLLEPAEETAAMPWDDLNKEGLLELAKALELVDADTDKKSVKKEDLIEGIATLYSSGKKGKKKVEQALAPAEEEAEGSEVDLGFDSLSAKAVKTAKAAYKGYSDADSAAYLSETYGFAMKKPKGATDLAIKADALYADLAEKYDEAVLKEAVKAVGLKLPKGARGVEAILPVLIGYALTNNAA